MASIRPALRLYSSAARLKLYSRKSYGIQQLVRTVTNRGTAPSVAGFNDYEEECRNFQLKAPEYFNFASDILDKWALKYEQEGRTKPAFWWIDERGKEVKWTYQELADMTKKCANVLTGPMGLRQGDRLIVMLPRIPQWWLLNIACVRTGVVLLPGTTMMSSSDVEYRIKTAKVRSIITDEKNMDKVEEALKNCPEVTNKAVVNAYNPRLGWYNFDDLMNTVSSVHQCVKTRADDPMQIFFTSGTTGRPKMALHTQASYGLGHVYTGRFWLDLGPDDLLWNYSDTGWAKSAYCSVFAPWIMGAATLVHHPTLPKFDNKVVLKMLEEYPISVFSCAPTGIRMLAQEKLTSYNYNKHLRHCASGGEPLNPEVSDVWLSGTGVEVRQGYGQTETVLVCGSWRCLKDKPGSMGRPAPGVPLEVIDEDGKVLGPGQEGDIAIRIKPERPFWLFREYVDNEKKNRECHRGDFYLTGDRAKKDEDGYFWFIGRDDDIILSSGYRIGPFEVESALIEHPAVAESAVVSSPDKTRMEIVKAFVVLSEDYKNTDQTQLKAELQNHVRSTTAPYKYPRKIEFLDQLPKTVSGKIRRVELRQREWEKISS